MEVAENNMKKQTQESKQTVTDGDAFYQWIPYAAASAVFVLAFIAGMIRENIWMVFGSGLPALAVFLIVRMAFPRPDSSQSAN